jgi:hypothetical protein
LPSYALKVLAGALDHSCGSCGKQELCFTQVDPAPAKPADAKQCTDFPGAKKVGDSWEVTTPMGKLKATLQKGRP